MALTEREGIILQELKTWESEMRSDEPTDFEAYYDRLIESLFTLLPESVQEEFFAKLDNWLFHLHSMITNLSSRLMRETEFLRMPVYSMNMSKILKA